MVVHLITHKRLHLSFASVLLIRFVCGSLLYSHSCSVLPQKWKLHARLARKIWPRYLECITRCTNAVDKPNDSQITYKFTPAAWYRTGCMRQGQLPVAVSPNLGENRVACPLNATWNRSTPSSCCVSIHSTLTGVCCSPLVSPVCLCQLLSQHVSQGRLMGHSVASKTLDR